MDEALINTIAGAVSGTGQVNINLATLSATAVSVPKAFFQKVSSDGKTAQIVMPDGNIVFTAGALNTLTGQSGDRILLTLHVQNVSTLPVAQRNVINTSTDRVYNITVSSGGTAITSFAGPLTITLSYTGQIPANLYHLSDAGTLTHLTDADVVFSGTGMNRTVRFTRESLSIYLVRYTPEVVATPTPPPDVPQTSDDTDLLMLGIVALAAISGLVVLVVIRIRFMTGKEK